MRINGTSLKRTRELAGLTQLGLSTATGVSQGRISALEVADPPAEVRPPTVKKLADALGVGIADLILDEQVTA